jgi:integrase
VPRHTTMPPRTQRTPHGDVTLTSRWMRDRYYLVATGSEIALHWMFPTHTSSFELISNESQRYAFAPAPKPITIERELRVICARWQDAWTVRFEDEQSGATTPAAAEPLAVDTVGRLFDHLAAIRASTLATTTQERDRYYRGLWLKQIPGTTPLRAVTEALLVKARDALAKATSPTTANGALGMLKAYLGWAHNNGLVTTAFFKNIKPLREGYRRLSTREWWTAEEVTLALEVAGADRHQPTAVLVVALGCFLGLRVEEAIMLRWQDLNLDAKDPKTGEPRPVAHVTPHGGWQPKDGEARDIPICTALHELLLRHRRPEGYLLVAEPDKQMRTRKAHAPWAYRYDPRRLWTRLMAALTARGGRPITMYGMRHTFCSNLLIAGVSDLKVARWLGHADTRMIHKHYGHLLSYDSDINAVQVRRQPAGNP